LGFGCGSGHGSGHGDGYMNIQKQRTYKIIEI
jgi:hypothetical protein